MKTTHETYYVGQMIDLLLSKPERGSMPISRTDDGVICLIQSGIKKFYPYGSTWECEIVEIHDKKLVILPMECIKSEKEETAKVGALLRYLKKPAKEKKQKQIKSYQYRRNG